MKDYVQTIGKLIDQASVSIISSVDEAGFPNTKAMLAPRKREGVRCLYFSTNTASMRAGQYAVNPKACVYFFNRRFFEGVMLRGTMEVLHDSSLRELIWREGDEIYYPQGVNDPDYCVFKFTALNGRYYSNFKSEDFDVR